MEHTKPPQNTISYSQDTEKVVYNIVTFDMSWNKTPKEVAKQFKESDWENSTGSSDEDDHFFIPEFSSLNIASNDHLELAEESETEEDSKPTIQPQNKSSNSPGDTSATGSVFSDPIPFNEPVGPAIKMDSTSIPLDFFNVTFGIDIMELPVEQTNLYAEQNPPSAHYKWYNTTIFEMYLLLGTIIAMGVHCLPSFVDYCCPSSLGGKDMIGCINCVHWLKNSGTHGGHATTHQESSLLTKR